MKKFLLLAMIMALPFAMNAQYQKMLDVLEDTEKEADGLSTLRFFNAMDAAPVSEASIEIPNIGNFKTDPSGKVSFNIPQDGRYPFKFSKEGFISANYEFEVVAGTVFYNRFSVSPKMELGYMRLVLEWGGSPADLDLHLEKKNAYHISYHHLRRSQDGNVRLDHDDTNGRGPETITIGDVDDRADYVCYVEDYTNRSSRNSQKLSNSKAVLRVYEDNQLIKVYYIPTKQKGNTWELFKIQSGNIIDMNRLP